MDWLRMDTGEWFSGTLERLLDGALSFRSEALGEVQLDWDGVSELRTAQPLTCVLMDFTELTGTGGLRDGRLFLETPDGVRLIPQEEVFSLHPGEPAEWHLWTGELSLGFNGTVGNTRAITAFGNAEFVRRDVYTRLTLGYWGNYSEAEGLEQEDEARTHLGLLKLDVYLTRDVYLIPAELELAHDKPKNVHLRATAGAGVGYQLLADPALIEAELLPSYTYLVSRRTHQGNSSHNEQAHLNGRLRVSCELAAGVVFSGQYTARVGISHIKHTRHDATVTLSVALIDDLLSLDLNLVWSRVERPERDEMRKRPRRDDATFGVGITCKL